MYSPHLNGAQSQYALKVACSMKRPLQHTDEDEPATPYEVV